MYSPSFVGIFLALAGLTSAAPIGERPSLAARAGPNFNYARAQYNTQRLHNIETKYDNIEEYIQRNAPDAVEQYKSTAQKEMDIEIQMYLAEAKTMAMVPKDMSKDPTQLYNNEEVIKIVGDYEIEKIKSPFAHDLFQQNEFGIRQFINDEIAKGGDKDYWQNQLEVYDQFVEDRAHYEAGIDHNASTEPSSDAEESDQELDFDDTHSQSDYHDSSSEVSDFSGDHVDTIPLDELDHEVGDHLSGDVPAEDINLGEVGDELEHFHLG